MFIFPTSYTWKKAITFFQGKRLGSQDPFGVPNLGFVRPGEVTHRPGRFRSEVSLIVNDARQNPQVRLKLPKGKTWYRII